MKPRFVLLILLLALVAGLGCGARQAPPTDSGPPVVNVSHPIQRKVVDYIDYTGRTDAIYSVDIRPRVTGYLTKMPFTEGSDVKKNELLFEVDPRPYQAQLDQAIGQLELAKARLKVAKANNELAKQTAKTPGAISVQDVNKYQASEEEALADVDAATANVEVNRLNREFCEVTSPIDGQVSRYYFTLGNLVNQDQTLLTTVVSLDPIYAYFDIDERQLLRIRSAINEGRLRMRGQGEIPILMGVQGETGYPHDGVVNFINNKVDPYTGTITLRGKFDNPKPENGRRILSPGMFVRVRIPMGDPHEALLVTDRAVGTDQGLKYLYVVDAQNKVQYRRVTLGPLQDDGLRVISEGLEKDDWVAVSGLQQIRPRMEVKPAPISMPIPTEEASTSAAPVPEKPTPAIKTAAPADQPTAPGGQRGPAEKHAPADAAPAPKGANP
ncbi:MAG TPA: efflux RND transporter periplasmic adaptor subunit [Pirellulales bacterium]|nr:efflux RND transporter periplasmic adaptor subunit [Pirellulales bacterium]